MICVWLQNCLLKEVWALLQCEACGRSRLGYCKQYQRGTRSAAEMILNLTEGFAVGTGTVWCILNLHQSHHRPAIAKCQLLVCACKAGQSVQANWKFESSPNKFGVQSAVPVSTRIILTFPGYALAIPEYFMILVSVPCSWNMLAQRERELNGFWKCLS